jgi:NADH-quinone oxidoreductase subunit N
MWVPDTYLGATPAVAAYLSVVSQTAGFAGILILLAGPFAALIDTWSPLIAVVAALTMTLGNLAALRQRDAVGLLAWSSVAQAGFVLAPIAALVAATERAIPDWWLRCATWDLRDRQPRRLRGGGTRTEADRAKRLERVPWPAAPRPRLRVTLAVALLALAGFPPAVIGLVAKYVVLAPVVEDGKAHWLL